MLRGSIRLGRVAGIEIRAHWSLLATLGLLSWLLAGAILPARISGPSPAQFWIAGVAAAVGLLVSLLAHELAHSVVAGRYGVGVDGITLWLLGGVSELRDEPPNPKADLRIALAGPLTSVGIGVVALAAASFLGPPVPELVTATIGWLGATNLVLAVFNLLPGAPLDGGRVVRAVLWRRTGDRLAAASGAARSGRAVGLALILLGAAETLALGSAGGLWLMLLGWFLRTAANAELANASLRHQLGDTRIGDVMTPSPVAAPARWSVAQLLAVAARGSHHRVFPVVDDGHRPTGVVSLSDLTPVPEGERTVVAVADRARPLPAAARVPADASLAEVASRVLLRPGLDLVAVVSGERLVGIVTATDLVRACDRSALGLPIRRTPPPDEQTRPGSP